VLATVVLVGKVEQVVPLVEPAVVEFIQVGAGGMPVVVDHLEQAVAVVAPLLYF
jgi:hypothetical protein